jgi:hypothetical protein
MIQLTLQAQTLQNLRPLLQPTEEGTYDFLGFTLNLESGTLTDNFGDDAWNLLIVRVIPAMLTHYTQGHPTQLTGKLVKFKDTPGGYSYEDAFIRRAIKPIEAIFGGNPQELVATANRFGGKQLKFGDASAEIPALRGIPLTYILHGSEEFGASANILFDQSASSYLPTEDLAVLGELTTYRLVVAKNALLHR